MVFDKIKEAFSPQSDEKYEILYHRYSKVKLENKKLKQQHREDLHKYKVGTHKNVAESLIQLYSDVETAKMSSFKIHAKDKATQSLMIDLNKIEKTMKETMKNFQLSEVVPQERYFDPDLHDVASYQDAKDMRKGIIVKTVKKGFKYRGDLIQKPKVVVTR